ncbi:ATP-binding protein [Terrimonas pollutisoli]|uniref:ATP-binding protein n=1 Tax=Terrimonas pollutisoli TaxID=3034147 RepID=UPI0023EADD16|nr:ATP-binding protein [Terrimonas sp. H1YJ31]
MPEQQNIEYKQSWHDDYLKWICGFANANGGVIYIGKDDNGNVVDVPDYKKLMDDIPNKIRNAMGITVEVNLHEEHGKHLIEVITQPYSVPISVRGRYYYRSGSTKQELTGATLNEFLLKKSGKTWDDVVEQRATFDDIDEKAVKTFLAASENAGRLPENNHGLSIPELFEKLRLTENGQLKRAAIILFGKDPGKFYPNIFVKIGRFGQDDTDIKFQETEEGNLIVLLQAVLNQLNHKFLIRSIEFEGIHRIEKGEYPLPALREMLLNALVHRNYMGAPIQIRVYDDKISIWNEGTLPEGLTLAALKRSHSSRPRNPIIADVAFKGGYIDAWGRGTIKILDTCKQAELPEPEMQELDGGFSITLFKNILTEEQLKKLGLNGRQIKAVLFVKEKGKITNKEYQDILGVARITATRDLQSLVKKRILKSSETKGAGSYYELGIAP